MMPLQVGDWVRCEYNTLSRKLKELPPLVEQVGEIIAIYPDYIRIERTAGSPGEYCWVTHDPAYTIYLLTEKEVQWVKMKHL